MKRSPSLPAGLAGGLPHRVFTYQYDTKTDDHGRFAFDRVIPGPGLVTRAIVTNFGRFSQHLVCGGQAVDIQPGVTAKVRIGGKGGRSSVGSCSTGRRKRRSNGPKIRPR